MGTVFESYSRRQGVDSDTISGHLSGSQPTTRKIKLFVFLLMTMLVTVHGQNATVTTAAEATTVANTATDTTAAAGDGTDVATGDDTDAGTDDTDGATDEECVDTKSAKKCKKALQKNKCNKKKYAIGCAKTCGYCEAA